MKINNEFNSLNFGMALKIKNKSKANIINSDSERYLNKLFKIGDELKNTKYVDLIIDGSDVMVKTPDRTICNIIGASNEKNKLDVAVERVETHMERWSDNDWRPKKYYSRSDIKFDMKTTDDAIDAVERINSTQNKIDKYVEVAKAIESSYNYLHDIKEMAKTDFERKVDVLLSKFGID